MLDLFYLAVGCLALFVFWAFTKACDKLEENKNAQHHCCNYLSKDEMEKWHASFSLLQYGFDREE
jgi:hypothetical protein